MNELRIEYREKFPFDYQLHLVPRFYKEANDANEVVMFVNGVQNDDYEHYVMQDGDVIDIEYREK